MDKQCLIVLDGVFTLVILQSNHVLIYLNTLDQLIAGYGVNRFGSIESKHLINIRLNFYL